MESREELRESEDSALNGAEFVTRVYGKKSKGSGKMKKGVGAAIFVTIMIAVFAVLFSSGNLIPSAISERLVEETDVQYADAVESKIVVFQQALYSGDVPSNTAERLKQSGVLVGQVKDGEFTETNKSDGNLSLKVGDRIITAGDFKTEINDNASLYKAFNEATYSRAAYYYDQSAQRVFSRMGASRNNFKGEESFEEVMTKTLGEGSNIDVNSVGLYEKKNDKGEIYYEYGTVGSNTDSRNSASAFVENVSNKNSAADATQATLNAANALNVADTISKEQKSSIFFLTFMENISKMKAGYGSESKINEAMNYLYRQEESTVVDVKTGEEVAVSGSMLESPSLYAILSGEKVATERVANYSSDRVLKTIENQLGTDDAGEAISSTVASSTRGIRGVIGRLISWGKSALSDVIAKITPTIDSSLINNAFGDIKGVRGGEMLVEGAVNVGKELAKASGATAGDATSVKTYAKLSESVLALDAKADRLSRSPFDVTSKNTFLGSIMYNLAVGTLKSKSWIGRISVLASTTARTLASFLPTSYADENNTEAYLTSFGDCETLGSIGAVGSASCAMVATFDTSTLDNIYGNTEFINFVEENTILKDGVRTIKSGSTLAKFIVYNNERVTPVGVVDGGILKSNNSQSISFVSDILQMIRNFLNVNDEKKREASGAAFVNSATNQAWDTYKYAQRYISLARATEALRQYDGDKTAYANLKFFEGTTNPVIAFLNDYYQIANR